MLVYDIKYKVCEMVGSMIFNVFMNSDDNDGNVIMIVREYMCVRNVKVILNTSINTCFLKALDQDNFTHYQKSIKTYNHRLGVQSFRPMDIPLNTFLSL